MYLSNCSSPNINSSSSPSLSSSTPPPPLEALAAQGSLALESHAAPGARSWVGVSALTVALTRSVVGNTRHVSWIGNVLNVNIDFHHDIQVLLIFMASCSLTWRQLRIMNLERENWVSNIWALHWRPFPMMSFQALLRSKVSLSLLTSLSHAVCKNRWRGILH